MFWKIQFDGEKTGFGWVQFNEAMEAIGLFEEDGTPIVNEGVDYHPIEFDTTPEWA